MRIIVSLAVLPAAALVVLAPAARAWADPSIWDGVFTAAQAQRGQDLYTAHCASCHREHLEGKGPTPSLAGSDFLERWDGQVLDDLFEKTQDTMPADHPGTLSREQNASILASILRFNSLPAGESELRTDSEWLRKVRFVAAKPK